MRTRTVLALAVLVALVPAACARNSDDGPGVATALTAGPTAAASPSATASRDPDAPLKFAQCMRQHGMTWFPDPAPGGRMNIRTPKGLDPNKMQAAQEACKKYAPSGGPGGQKPSAADLEKLRQMAQCMREHGVPNFPDPNPDGGLMLDRGKLGTGPGEPTFDKAQQACAKYRPGRGETVTGGGSKAGTGDAGLQGATQ